MKGPSCEVLDPQVKALESWAVRIHERTTPAPSCLCENQTCSVDITHSVPKIIQERESTRPGLHGPNCWNASLVGSKVLSALRYTTSDEMRFWLTSPLCSERAMTESPEPGDIIAIRNSTSEIHGFIHLTPELSFSKNGYSHVAPYHLEGPAAVFKKYKVPENCRRVHSSEGESCPVYATYFKCESMDDYTKKRSPSSAEIMEQMKALDDLECAISGVTMNAKGEVGSLTALSLRTVNIFAREKLEDRSVTEEDKFLWRGIAYKADSLLKQLDWIEAYQSGLPSYF